MKKLQLTDWLPTTRKEMDLRGWDCADVIIFSGDAYVAVSYTHLTLPTILLV